MMNTATPMPTEKPMMALSPNVGSFRDAADCKTEFSGIKRVDGVGSEDSVIKTRVVLVVSVE